jgi:hypothetical protein
MSPPPSLVPRKTPGGCCGCIVFPSIVGVLGGAVFWFAGCLGGLLLHGLAALLWAATHALGHFLFGWPLPQLGPRDQPRDRLDR